MMSSIKQTKTSRAIVPAIPKVGAIAAALLLSACGGSDTASTAATATDSPTNTSSIVGRAADGYLTGAVACLDVNDNGSCETDEPQTTTTAGGHFSIDLPTGMDSDHVLLVEVTTSTIDEDTNSPVPNAYVLKAPAGQHQFVSPLTTLVQNELDADPAMNVDSAELSVRNQLGLVSTVAEDEEQAASLFEDYVAGKAETDNINQDTFARLHLVAQTTATIMGTQTAAIEATALAASLDQDALVQELFNLIMDSVTDLLPDIMAGVVNFENSDQTVAFDPTTIASTFDHEEFESDTLRQNIERKTIAGEKRKLTLSDLSELSLYSLTSLDNGHGYFEVEFTENNTATNGTEFQLSNNSWTQIADAYTDQRLSLSERGDWVQRRGGDGHYELTQDANGNINARHTVSSENLNFLMTSIDLAAKPITPFLVGMNEYWADELEAVGNLGSSTFPEGSVAYTFTGERVEQEWILERFIPNDNDICNSMVGSVSAADLDGNCAGLRDVESGAYARDFADILHQSTDASSHVAGEETFRLDGSNTNEVFAFWSRNLADANQGLIHYYNRTYGEGATNEMVPIGTGSWSLQIIHSQHLFVAQQPVEIKPYLNSEFETGRTPFIIDESYVRYGHLYAKGYIETSDSDQYYFNRSALNHLNTVLGISTVY